MNETTDRRRKETQSGTRREQLCIKLKQATSKAFPWYYARASYAFRAYPRVALARTRASIRVSHDCRCSRNDMLPIKPHQRCPGRVECTQRSPTSRFSNDLSDHTRGSLQEIRGPDEIDANGNNVSKSPNSSHGAASHLYLSLGVLVPSRQVARLVRVCHFSGELMRFLGSSRFRCRRYRSRERSTLVCPPISTIWRVAAVRSKGT